MPEIRARVEDGSVGDLRILGRRQRHEFKRLQQIADVVVTPEVRSVYNELAVPLKLLDCLSSGRPTVATRIASHVDIVVDGVNGYLAEAEDSRSMAAALKRALLDPSAALVGQMGRRTVLENHTWLHSARRAATAYARVIDGAAPASS
jgi:glycosyltransferase involved in cell wall biosynthesis